MKWEKETLFNDIKQADLMLIGLGEEFNAVKDIRNASFTYEALREKLGKEQAMWLLPAYQRFLREKAVMTRIYEALQNLSHLLENKNYYVISTSTNECIPELPWKAGKVVMPCGNTLKKQCSQGCEDTIAPVTEMEWEALKIQMEKMQDVESFQKKAFDASLGKCPKCGTKMVFNSIYSEKYDEQGYLKAWENYTRWLQGTVNKNLLILELGVGMQYPSVIRWPFEKIAFFNSKAKIYRVNKNLYQLTEELKEKGISISQNAIDWLSDL